MTRVRKALMCICATVGLTLAFFSGWLGGRYAQARRGSSGRNVELFQAIRSSGETQDERRRAAQELAQSATGRWWCTALLLDQEAFTSAGAPPEVRAALLAQFDRAAVVAVIEALPEDSEDMVLWAVTDKLDVEESGSVSSRFGIGPYVLYRDGETEPIQQVARSCLRRCLGCDHRYDIYAWRKAILERPRDGTRTK